MRLKHPKILLTGPPRVGKTTLIRNATARIPEDKIAGFVTTEILRGGVRQGFSLEGLHGQKGLLAHVKITSRYRVGKYGVDVAGFEAFVERLDLLRPGVKFVVIDEIGKMEIFSERFCDQVREVADSEKMLLATVAEKGGGLIAEIKRRPDIRLLTVTPANRDGLLYEILASA